MGVADIIAAEPACMVQYSNGAHCDVDVVCFPILCAVVRYKSYPNYIMPRMPIVNRNRNGNG